MKRADPRYGRTLKFLCVHDDTTRVFRDWGYMKDGTTSGQRQAVLRYRDKTCRIDGRDVAVFALAEPPTEDFSDRDPLDRSLKTNTGEWMLPSEGWLEVRQRRIEITRALAEEQSQRSRELATSHLADQLGKLMDRTVKEKRPS